MKVYNIAKHEGYLKVFNTSEYYEVYSHECGENDTLENYTPLALFPSHELADAYCELLEKYLKEVA